jgi:hypothetical protein
MPAKLNQNTTILFVSRFSVNSGITDGAWSYVAALKTITKNIALFDTRKNKFIENHIGLRFSENKSNVTFSPENSDSKIILIYDDSPKLLKKFNIFGAVRLISIFVFETIDVNRNYFFPLLSSHQIWTASKANLSGLKRIAPNFMLKKIPHVNLNDELKDINIRKADLVKFLIVATHEQRRRLPLIINKYFKLFEKDNNISLTLKISTNCQKNVEKYIYLENLISNKLNSHNVDENLQDILRQKNITIISDYLSEFQMEEVFNSHNVVINIEFGNGWDLPSMHAISYGCICIGVKNNSHADFLNQDIDILLESDIELISKDDYSNEGLYANHKGNYIKPKYLLSSMESAVSKIRKGIRKKRDLSQYSKENIGQLILKNINDLNSVDFFENGSPKIIYSKNSSDDFLSLKKIHKISNKDSFIKIKLLHSLILFRNILILFFGKKIVHKISENDFISKIKQRIIN